PGDGAAARGGTHADQCKRSRRSPNQAHSGICSLPEWRADCDGGRKRCSSRCGDRRCGKEPPACDLPLSLLRSRWRSHFLWSRYDRTVPSSSGLRRSHPQGREARRPPCAGADKVRTGRQPQDREGARPRNSSDRARPRRRGDRVKRREFITLLGGAAASWPFVAEAQQPGKLPTIGYLGATTPSTESQRVAALVRGLRDCGWIESRNLTIKYRYGEGRSERYPDLAAEFVRLNVHLIVTYETPAVAATKQATAAIPIVFAVAGDPIGSGLVASLPRPGGNVTGLSLPKTDVAQKTLHPFRDNSPGLSRL